MVIFRPAHQAPHRDAVAGRQGNESYMVTRKTLL